MSARPGAARIPLAPAALAASVNRCSDVASAWPNARPTPYANVPSRNGYMPTASLNRRCDRAGPSWMIRSATAERNAAMPSAATTSRTRATRPRCAKTSSRRVATSTPSRSATQPRWDRVPAVAANADAKRRNAIDRLSAQAHVGGNAVEIERAAAIDRDRDFGGKSLAPASCVRARGANRRRALRHR